MDEAKFDDLENSFAAKLKVSSSIQVKGSAAKREFRISRNIPRTHESSKMSWDFKESNLYQHFLTDKSIDFDKH